jgi:hypothetical protein
MPNKEELLSALGPEDWDRIEAAARAANQEPKDWLKDLVTKAASVADLRNQAATEDATEKTRLPGSSPGFYRASLRVEHIERDEGLVRLHVRLLEGKVTLSRGCSFGDARLRLNNEDTRLVSDAVDPRQIIFVLANPHDASRFEKGQAYEFKGTND